jgi:hypothetical protein
VDICTAEEEEEEEIISKGKTLDKTMKHLLQNHNEPAAMHKSRELMTSFSLKDATKVTIQRPTLVWEAHALGHSSLRKRHMEGATAHL